MKRKQFIWQEPGTKPLFVMVIILILCFWGGCDLAYGDGVGFSWDLAEGFVPFQHFRDCDSARFYFAYPDSTNFYENVKLLPIDVTDSSTLSTTDLALDSFGVHIVKVWYWEAGSADSIRIDAFWYHYAGWTGPPPDSASSVDFVAAYIDAGSGIVDGSGHMVPRRGVKFFLDLVGSPGMHTDTWALIPQSYEGKPTPAGRVTFNVPANTKITPSGSYYVLRYRAADGRSLTRGVVYSFQLDTLPDPIMIFDATAIY